MAKQQNKASGIKPTSLPKGGMAVGPHGGAGVLDPSTLPKPTLPPWDGWKNINRAVK